MSKLEQLHLEAINNNICSESNYSGILGKNEAAFKSAEITEQIAIEFADFIRCFCIIDWDADDRQVYVYQGNFFYTPKDLFEEFLKTKQ